MKMWKVEIKAMPKSRVLLESKCRYSYTGIATTAEIAIRQTRRVAKKDGLSQIEVENVMLLGLKEFG